MSKFCKILFLYLMTSCVLFAQVSDEDISKSVKEYDLANIAMMKKQDEEAYTHLQNAAEFDPSNSTFLNSASYMAMHLGHLDVALDYLDKAMVIDVKKYGDNHPNVASIFNNMGSVWSKKGDHKKAVDYYDKAYAIIAKSLGEKHPQVVSVKRIRDEEAAKLN
jgi:tetratricopeptide (TPR) repeat protein